MQKEEGATVHFSLSLGIKNKETHSEAILLRLSQSLTTQVLHDPTHSKGILRANLGPPVSKPTAEHRLPGIPQAANMATREEPSGRMYMFVVGSRFKQGQREHIPYFAM